MNTHEHKAAQLLVSSLSQNKPTRFALVPSESERRALADVLDIPALKKLRFEGQITPEGKRGFALSAQLGATVTQDCVITLAPVTTRIDEPYALRFVPPAQMDRYAATSREGDEMEMPEDETLEELGDVIDLNAVMQEALALSLPAYPRVEGTELSESTFAEAGIAPLQDADLKPLAGLAALKAKMDAQNGDETADEDDVAAPRPAKSGDHTK